MLQCGADEDSPSSAPVRSAATTARSSARAGHDVTFIARGAHLAAIRERGLEMRSPALGDFIVRAPAEEDTSRVGPVDVVIVAVKAYDNATALPTDRADARAGHDRS